MLIPRKAALLARLVDPKDYNPNSVLVEPGVLTVTNGHVLLRAEYEAHEDADYPMHDGKALAVTNGKASVTVDAETLLAMAKAVPVKDVRNIPILGYIAVEQSEGGTRLHVTDMESVTSKRVGEQREFPSWQKVVPDEAQAKVVIGLSVKVLSTILQAAKDSEASAVKLSIQAHDQAVRVEFEGATDAKVYGAVMPFKVEGGRS